MSNKGVKGMKMYILDLGYMEMDMNNMLAGMAMGVSFNQTPPCVWGKIPVWAVLIDHPEKGWILYDTGCAPDAMEDGWPDIAKIMSPMFQTEENHIVNQLAKVGITPADVKTVVLSHGHYDHAGGLKLFTEAEVIWAEGDFLHAMKHLYGDPNAPGMPFIRKELMDIHPKKITFIDEAIEVAPGVEAIPMSGHTPGVLALVVHLEGKSYIFPGDNVDLMANLGDGVNFRAAGPAYDSLGWSKSLKQVVKLGKEYDAEIIAAHDMAQFEGLKKAPEFYA